MGCDVERPEWEGHHGHQTTDAWSSPKHMQSRVRNGRGGQEKSHTDEHLHALEAAVEEEGEPANVPRKDRAKKDGQSSSAQQLSWGALGLPAGVAG